MARSAVLGGGRAEPPSDRPRSGIISALEDFVIAVIILGPVLGMFSPPEGYLSPHSYAVDAAAYETEYPISAVISRLVYAVIFLLTIKHWRQYLIELRYAIWALILFSIYVSSALWSEEPTVTLRQSLHYFEYTIVAAHLLWRFNEEGLTQFFLRVLSVLTAASFIVMLISPRLGHSIDTTAYQTAWRGATNNKNALGEVAVLAILISIYVIFYRKSQSYLAFFVLIGNLLLLYESKSMTSVLGLFITVYVTLMIILLRTSVGKLYAFLSGAVAFMFIAYVLVISDSFTAFLGRSATLTGRTDVWRYVIPLIWERPILGHGIGFWAFLTRDKATIWGGLGWATPHAHNDYLDLLLQIGILGASVAILNNLRALRQGFTLIREQRTSTIPYFAILLFFVVRGFSETISVFPGTNIMMIIIICQMRLWKTYINCHCSSLCGQFGGCGKAEPLNMDDKGRWP